jgi:HSP20 family protein
MFSRFVTLRSDRDQWTDAFAVLDALRRHTTRVLRESDDDKAWSQGISGDLSAELVDVGEAFVVKAFVPGLDEKDLKLTLTEDVLTLAGRRAADAPRDYTTHRQERAEYDFARSFSLPKKIDPERVNAELKDGVLSVRMQKAHESKPRQITIKTN